MQYVCLCINVGYIDAPEFSVSSRNFVLRMCTMPKVFWIDALVLFEQAILSVQTPPYPLLVTTFL